MEIVKIYGQGKPPFTRAEAHLIEKIADGNNIIVAKGTFKFFENERMIKQLSLDGDSYLLKIDVFKGYMSPVNDTKSLKMRCVSHGCETALILCRAGAVFYNSRSKEYLLIKEGGEIETTIILPGKEENGGKIF